MYAYFTDFQGKINRQNTNRHVSFINQFNKRKDRKNMSQTGYKRVKNNGK